MNLVNVSDESGGARERRGTAIRAGGEYQSALSAVKKTAADGAETPSAERRP
jgi:hypothetical protein